MKIGKNKLYLRIIFFGDILLIQFHVIQNIFLWLKFPLQFGDILSTNTLGSVLLPLGQRAFVHLMTVMRAYRMLSTEIFYLDKIMM